MLAYRAETALVRSLTPHYAKTEDDDRALIREILRRVRTFSVNLKIIGCWFASIRSRILAATKPWPNSARCSTRLRFTIPVRTCSSSTRRPHPLDAPLVPPLPRE